jgi:hypothetical protein
LEPKVSHASCNFTTAKTADLVWSTSVPRPVHPSDRGRDGVPAGHLVRAVAHRMGRWLMSELMVSRIQPKNSGERLASVPLSPPQISFKIVRNWIGISVKS